MTGTGRPEPDEAAATHGPDGDPAGHGPDGDGAGAPGAGAGCPTGAWDAMVLAGGAGRRLGVPGSRVVKPEVVVAGRPLVDHALAAVEGARRRVLVGSDALARPGVLTTLEDPPLGGPVAGIAAGLELLDRSGPGDDDVVVVLACDVPRAGLVVPALVAAAREPGAHAARLVDDDGCPQHLVAAFRYHALRRAVAGLRATHGASVRDLVAAVTFADVPDPGGAAADADTWPDVRRLDAELGSAADQARGVTAGRADGGTIGALPREPGRLL